MHERQLVSHIFSMQKFVKIHANLQPMIRTAHTDVPLEIQRIKDVRKTYPFHPVLRHHTTSPPGEKQATST